MAPAELERLLNGLPGDPYAIRLLSGLGHHEDAAVLSLPDAHWWNTPAHPVAPAPKIAPKKATETATKKENGATALSVPLSKLALTQTVDVLPPVVNDPFKFGQIAAANALSDIYAMGGKPWSAMNILNFPSRDLPLEVGTAILNGGADKLAEAQVALAGGHTLEDPELKYGLAVTGFVRRGHFATNSGLRCGDILLLSKPLGIGALSTALQGCLAEGDSEEAEKLENEIYRWASLLNAAPGLVIQKLGLHAATDVTGFGLAGHILEMAEASDKRVKIMASALPLLPGALECAESGLLPAGCHANRRHCGSRVQVTDTVPLALSDLCFDPQTSGGMLLAVSESQIPQATSLLTDYGHLAVPVAQVFAPETEGFAKGAKSVAKRTKVFVNETTNFPAGCRVKIEY